MFLMMFLCIVLILLINTVYYIIKEKGLYEREKFTSYECGFESKIKSRILFSLRFFLLTIIYLLFDIEILIAFSYVYSIFWMTNFMNFLLFMIFCLATLYFEWIEGSLDWIK